MAPMVANGSAMNVGEVDVDQLLGGKGPAGRGQPAPVEAHEDVLAVLGGRLGHRVSSLAMRRRWATSALTEAIT